MAGGRGEARSAPADAELEICRIGRNASQQSGASKVRLFLDGAVFLELHEPID